MQILPPDIHLPPLNEDQIRLSLGFSGAEGGDKGALQDFIQRPDKREHGSLT